MQQFIVDPVIFERFPGMRIVAVIAHGIDNTVPRPTVEEAWRSAWAGAATESEHGNAQSHPHIVPWRERFREMGVSPKSYPSSIQALLRRAMKGGEPFTINPLVDFYNAVSLSHVAPAGAFDLDTIPDTLDLRLTRDGDTFHALDADEPVPLPPGEIAYTSGSTTLTRHFVWRQSREALIQPHTRSALLLSEIPGELGPDLADAMLNAFCDGLTTHFDVTPEPHLLDAEHRMIG
jgi:DNA/RNA-binding domain of Phe-tRNA-synthetase-like protein